MIKFNFDILKLNIFVVLNMTFWERVEEIIERKEINKKELASAAGIDASTISKGIKNNTVPSADTAVLIAQYLGTTVEYLVTGSSNNQGNIPQLYKHVNLIENLDAIPEDARASIELMITDMGRKYKQKK